LLKMKIKNGKTRSNDNRMMKQFEIIQNKL